MIEMGQPQDERHMRELRLFVEEICCNLCRFRHVHQDGVAPESVKVNQEVDLGIPEAFADIRVQVPGCAPYFVEVKYGYPAERIAAHLSRKYGPNTPGLEAASKLVLVVDSQSHENWPAIEEQVRSRIWDGTKLEVWDDRRLLSLIREHFDVDIDSISEGKVAELRTAIDKAKGLYAFGTEWTNDSLQSSLLWHLGFWRIKQLREKHGLNSRSIVPPSIYKSVAVILADLSSFSSYVRDTRDPNVVHHCLTSFYAKSRYEILNTGGMLLQFVGDEVIGLYGIPDSRTAYFQAALECARALVDIGNSVSNEWQRHLDRIQNARGVHIGMAVGDIQIVPLRPFGRADIGAVSDAINMAARLLGDAGPSEIVVSNTFYQGLDEKSQAGFQELGAVEARNMGTIKAWKMCLTKSRS